MLSKVVTMEHTTNRENDVYANSEITEELDREKGKVSFDKIKIWGDILYSMLNNLKIWSMAPKRK